MAAGTKRSIFRLSATLSATFFLATFFLAALAVAPVCGQAQAPAQPPAGGQGGQVNTLKQVLEKLFACWKAPAPAVAEPMDITVVVSFNRSGVIMGRPRITFESPKATDKDRLAYRLAVMEALQRCSPMPFTDTMAAAIAGRPLAVQFRTHLQSQERKAWLTPKIL
jgi:hypothetical protein